MYLLEAYLVPLVAFAAAVCLIASVRILREYERAVVFTLGRFEKVKGPGLVLLVPFIQEMVRVDLRIQVVEIPSQDVISRDNVSMKVDAVLYFNVVDPERAIIKVQNFMPATNMLAQTYLQTLTEIGAEQNSTVVFPMPIDIMKPFLDIIEKADRSISPRSNGADRPAIMTATTLEH
jgi:regulator of protease activity HflC (stomatin/prohibitin superfamily)